MLRARQIRAEDHFVILHTIAIDIYIYIYIFYIYIIWFVLCFYLYLCVLRNFVQNDKMLYKIPSRPRLAWPEHFVQHRQNASKMLCKMLEHVVSCCAKWSFLTNLYLTVCGIKISLFLDINNNRYIMKISNAEI